MCLCGIVKVIDDLFEYDWYVYCVQFGEYQQFYGYQYVFVVVLDGMLQCVYDLLLQVGCFSRMGRRGGCRRWACYQVWNLVGFVM